MELFLVIVRFNVNCLVFKLGFQKFLLEILGEHALILDYFCFVYKES